MAEERAGAAFFASYAKSAKFDLRNNRLAALALSVFSVPSVVIGFKPFVLVPLNSSRHHATHHASLFFSPVLRTVLGRVFDLSSFPPPDQ